MYGKYANLIGIRRLSVEEQSTTTCILGLAERLGAKLNAAADIQLVYVPTYK